MAEKRSWMVFVVSTMLALFAGIAAGKVDDKQWKEMKRSFRRNIVSSDPDTRINAVRELGTADRLEAVKLLIVLLGRDDPSLYGHIEKRRRLVRNLESIYAAAMNQGGKISQSEYARMEKIQAELQKVDAQITANDFIKYAAVGALAKTRDKKAVDYMLQKLKGAYSWRQRAAIAEALVKVEGEEVTKALMRAAADRDPKVRSSAIDSLGLRRLGHSDQVLDIFLKALKDRYWQVQVSGTRAIQHTRYSAGYPKKLRRAVEALVDLLRRVDGRLQEDVDAALKVLTGFTFHGDAKLWKSWWEGNKDRLLEVIKEKQKDFAQRGAKTTSFYGIETKSKRIMFIIDISGSMKAPAGRAGYNMDPKAPKSGTRLDQAKYELKKAIMQLRKKATFGVIYFHHLVKLYRNQLMQAHRGTQRGTAAWVDTLKAEGMTNIFDALDRAFQLAGQNFDRNYQSKVGIDTIFFLTDGGPTHGRITDPGKILHEVSNRNKLRKIVIHCIGLGEGINAQFLGQLATQNGGKFVHVK